MPRSDRLFDLLQILRDGDVHTAQEMAATLGVSERTIYRDMDRLQASGVPVMGARGTGYKATGATTLPPLSLTQAELEALNLGIAIVAEAADPALAEAAAALADKIDAVLPEQAISLSESWKFAAHPLSDTARGAGHLATLRSAIKARQKLDLTCLERDGTSSRHVVHPLQIDNWGRVWTLVAWSETARDFSTFRLDLIVTARALPELFDDAPGTTLADLEARKSR